MLRLTFTLLASFCYAIAILYGINDLDGILSYQGGFPLTALYLQATGSVPATFGLLFIIFLALVPCLSGTYLTTSRIWWALARDNVTPFPRFFAHVSKRWCCPIEATTLCAVLTVALGAITVGSKTAFTDLTGSFIILTSTSYAMAIVANVVTGRQNFPRGEFYMGHIGYYVNILTVLLITFFNIMFCFPPTYPTSVDLMNYNCVILVGVVVLTGIWWFVHGIRKYPGPAIAKLYHNGVEGESKVPTV